MTKAVCKGLKQYLETFIMTAVRCPQPINLAVVGAEQTTVGVSLVPSLFHVRKIGWGRDYVGVANAILE